MSTTPERTFRTRGEPDIGAFHAVGVHHLRCDIKTIKTTNEGAISIGIELTATDDDTLEQVRDLIRIQQGRCRLSIEGIQGEMDV